MITLCIILGALALILGMVLAGGAMFVGLFGDVIVAILVIVGIVKLVKWLGKKK